MLWVLGPECTCSRIVPQAQFMAVKLSSVVIPCHIQCRGQQRLPHLSMVIIPLTTHVNLLWVQWFAYHPAAVCTLHNCYQWEYVYVWMCVCCRLLQAGESSSTAPSTAAQEDTRKRNQWTYTSKLRVVFLVSCLHTNVAKIPLSTLHGKIT